MQEVIKVEQLTKSYGALRAVDGLSLSVERGMVFGLLGANGAGKSTTIECMLGTKKPEKGSVTILGSSPTADRKALFEKTGVQFQESNYQEQIRVAELCEVTASLYRNASDPAALLQRFGIGDKGKSLVKDLSGGQRQRLFIVLALIPNPEVVFLDELTTGLDAKGPPGGMENTFRFEGKGPDHLSDLPFYGRGGGFVRSYLHFNKGKKRLLRNGFRGGGKKSL